MGDDVPPQQRIEDMIRVAELCVDLLKENEEHHGEVSRYYIVSTILAPVVHHHQRYRRLLTPDCSLSMCVSMINREMHDVVVTLVQHYMTRMNVWFCVSPVCSQNCKKMGKEYDLCIILANQFVCEIVAFAVVERQHLVQTASFIIGSGVSMFDKFHCSPPQTQKHTHTLNVH